MGNAKLHDAQQLSTNNPFYRTRPVAMDEEHTPPPTFMGEPSHPATPFTPVVMPSMTALHARAAAPPGGEGAERTPSKVINSPTLAPSGGDKGFTLHVFERGEEYEERSKQDI